jgi:predicted metal-dependent phosphoesterase TrpH
MKAELHCHTNLSDGSFTFDEIIKLALKEDVSHLAITNHDTTKDLEDMVRKGKERGVQVIPGIEISAFDFKRNTRVHILGYYIDPGHSAIEAICGPLLERRHQGCCTMVSRLMEAGYSITLEQVAKYAQGGTGIYKQHIMHALIEQGYTTTIYGDLYKKLFSRGQDGEGPGIAYIPMDYVDAKAAIHAVLQAGGVPILAHPGQYRNFEAVPELVESGLQGIEVWHPLHGPNDEVNAQEYALKYDLLMTGGSDFHGFYGEKEVELGSKSPGLDIVKAIKARKEALVKN